MTEVIIVTNEVQAVGKRFLSVKKLQKAPLLVKMIHSQEVLFSTFLI